nr:MAG TPA: hypothetical protein [Caudoviricetes sp.]
MLDCYIVTLIVTLEIPIFQGFQGKCNNVTIITIDY